MGSGPEPFVFQDPQATRPDRSAQPGAGRETRGRGRGRPLQYGYDDWAKPGAHAVASVRRYSDGGGDDWSMKFGSCPVADHISSPASWFEIRRLAESAGQLGNSADQSEKGGLSSPAPSFPGVVWLGGRTGALVEVWVTLTGNRPRRVWRWLNLAAYRGPPPTGRPRIFVVRQTPRRW
jgi:hypothetical protein